MFSRIFKISVLIVAIFAVTVATVPNVSFSQTTSEKKPAKKKMSAKPKVTVPPGGCLIADQTAALENSKTCAANCKDGWCTVSTCINGSLTGSWIGCYEPSGLCVPKC